MSYGRIKNARHYAENAVITELYVDYAMVKEVSDEISVHVPIQYDNGYKYILFNDKMLYIKDFIDLI